MRKSTSKSDNFLAKFYYCNYILSFKRWNFVTKSFDAKEVHRTVKTRPKILKTKFLERKLDHKKVKMKFWKSFKSGSGSLANTFGTMDRKKQQQQQNQQQQQHHQQQQHQQQQHDMEMLPTTNSSNSHQNNNKKLSSYTPLSVRRRRSNTSRS